MHAQAAKQLADAVIPNEYGIDPCSKLRIGSKICTNLLGKVMADLGNMRDESIATAVSRHWEGGGRSLAKLWVVGPNASITLPPSPAALNHALLSKHRQSAACGGADTGAEPCCRTWRG